MHISYVRNFKVSYKTRVNMNMQSAFTCFNIIVSTSYVYIIKTQVEVKKEDRG